MLTVHKASTKESQSEQSELERDRVTLTKQKCFYKKTKFIQVGMNMPMSATLLPIILKYSMIQSLIARQQRLMMEAVHIFREIQLCGCSLVSLTEHVQRGTAVLHCEKRQTEERRVPIAVPCVQKNLENKRTFLWVVRCCRPPW